MPLSRNIRECTVADVPSATKLLNQYLKRFSIKTIFEENEFGHWFLPRDGIVNCYVIEVRPPEQEPVQNTCV